MFKSISQYIAVVFVIFSATMSVASAEAVDDKNPYVLLEQVGLKTFARIKEEQPNIKQDPEVLRTIVREELVPYIDYRFSAFKVLGKHFRKASKEELIEFVTVFREYLVTTYAVALGYYDDQTVQFAPAKELDPKDKQVVVRALVKDDDRPDIKISFSLRKDNKTNEWKAYDMVAEGISLLSSKQSEFESILRQEGIQRVIDLMKDKIEKPISLESNEKEA